MEQKIKVIINADDFGFSEGVNYGILKAHMDGVVTSTTIMANMPGFDHAVALAKQHPTLRIGVHLNITCGKPLRSTHTTMTNKEGYFMHGKEHKYDKQEVYEELCAQIDKVLAAGITIDHFDSHHHIHTEQHFQDIIEKILRKYPYPIRGGFAYKNEYPYQSILCTEFYDTGVDMKQFKKALAKLQPGNIYDIMCHPAYIDYDLVAYSSYRMQRVNEVHILCSKELQDEIASLPIELVTYNCI